MTTGLNKMFLIIPFFLFGLFLNLTPVNAVNNIDIENLRTPGNNNTGWVNIMQGFKPTKNNISGFSTWNNNDSINQTVTFDFYICKGTTTQSTLIYQSRSTSTEAEYGCGTTSPDKRIYRQMASVLTDTTAGTTNGTSTMYFTPIPVEIGQPYYFVFHYTAGQRNIFQNLNYNTYLATSTDVFFYNLWWNGQQRQIDNSGGTTGVDMPFATWYDFGLNEAKMTILAPTIGQRVMNGQPLTVTINIYNPNIAYNTGYIKLLNKKTWTALQDVVVDVSTTSATASFDIPFTDLDLANYRIWGYLIDYNTGLRSVDSNKVDFVVGTDTIFTGTDDSQYVKGGLMTEPQICGSIATSTFFGGIECAGKKLIYYALTPNEFAMEDLKKSWEKFKTKFPFSVYFQLTDTVKNAIASASIGVDDTFDVVMINDNKEIITLPVLDKNSMSDLVGVDNANMIRNTIASFIWLGVAFLIFMTFRTI